MALLDGLLDWKEMKILGHVPNFLLGPMVDLFQRRGSVPWRFHGDSYVLMSNDHLREPDAAASDGVVEARPLDRRWAKRVFDRWDYVTEGTAARMAPMFDKGLCYGTFVGDQLVSWICSLRCVRVCVST